MKEVPRYYESIARTHRIPARVRYVDRLVCEYEPGTKHSRGDVHQKVVHVYSTCVNDWLIICVWSEFFNIGKCLLFCLVDVSPELIQGNRWQLFHLGRINNTTLWNQQKIPSSIGSRDCALHGVHNGNNVD